MKHCAREWYGSSKRTVSEINPAVNYMSNTTRVYKMISSNHIAAVLKEKEQILPVICYSGNTEEREEG